MSEEYLGWTNWHTWNCHLWLTSDWFTYNFTRQLHTAENLRKWWGAKFEGKDGIDTDKVNFEEVLNALREE